MLCQGCMPGHATLATLCPLPIPPVDELLQLTLCTTCFAHRATLAPAFQALSREQPLHPRPRRFAAKVAHRAGEWLPPRPRRQPAGEMQGTQRQRRSSGAQWPPPGPALVGTTTASVSAAAHPMHSFHSLIDPLALPSHQSLQAISVLGCSPVTEGSTHGVARLRLSPAEGVPCNPQGRREEGGGGLQCGGYCMIWWPALQWVAVGCSCPWLPASQPVCGETQPPLSSTHLLASSLPARLPAALPSALPASLAPLRLIGSVL